MQTSSIIRILSIFAVLMIHVSAPYETILSQNHQNIHYIKDLPLILSIVFSQFARFSVPVFFILSGFGLAQKYEKENFELNKYNLKNFYIRRMKRILIPYLFWTILAFFFFYIFEFLNEWEKGISIGIDYLTHFFFIRGADYHFYFLIIMFQLYFFFPFLFYLIYNYRNLSKFVLFLLFIIHLFYSSPSYMILKRIGIERKIFPTIFFIYWIFYFYFGIYFSRNIDSFLEKINQIKKSFWFGFILISLFFILDEYFIYFNKNIEPQNYNHFQRITVFFYSIIIWMSFFRIIPSIHLSEKWIQINNQSLLEFLSYVSFHVYLFHPVYLRSIEWILNQIGFYSFIISLLFTTLISVFSGYIISNLFQYVSKKYQKLRLIFGL